MKIKKKSGTRKHTFASVWEKITVLFKSLTLKRDTVVALTPTLGLRSIPAYLDAFLSLHYFGVGDFFLLPAFRLRSAQIKLGLTRRQTDRQTDSQAGRQTDRPMLIKQPVMLILRRSKSFLGLFNYLLQGIGLGLGLLCILWIHQKNIFVILLKYLYWNT